MPWIAFFEERISRVRAIRRFGVYLLGVTCWLAGMPQSFAQISPPGIDGAKLVTWNAIGFNQHVSRKWSVTVYLGGARQSNPDNASLLHKQAIGVLNQEWQYQFNPHWQLVFANSFRVQNRYQDSAPYDAQDPAIRNEIRYYLRMYYRTHTGKVAWAYSFRPELRTFYTTRWAPWSSPTELRFRLKVQASVPLNASKSNQFIAANEWLFATDYNRSSPETGTAAYWSAFQFTEDRLTTYFRHNFQKSNIIVDLGLMHQFWRNTAVGGLGYTAYLSFDILFQNPFGKHAAQH